MVLSTLASGLRIRHVGMVSFIMLMEMFMRVNGLMTKPMEREHISMPTGQTIMVIGEMTSSMDLVLKDGQMALYMKVSTMKGRRTEEGSSYSQMDLSMRETFK